MDQADEKTLAILRDSLAEAQVTVRAYDTKAQIVGVGYIFALGIVQQIADQIPPASPRMAISLVAVGWVVVIFPIILFGLVLHPTRKTAPEVSEQLRSKLQQVLYVEPERHGSVEALQAALSRADPATEYAFELLKMIKLRELKRRRCLRALFAAAIAFIVLFLSHIGRTLA